MDDDIDCMQALHALYEFLDGELTTERRAFIELPPERVPAVLQRLRLRGRAAHRGPLPPAGRGAEPADGAASPWRSTPSGPARASDRHASTSSAHLPGRADAVAAPRRRRAARPRHARRRHLADLIRTGRPRRAALRRSSDRRSAASIGRPSGRARPVTAITRGRGIRRLKRSVVSGMDDTSIVGYRFSSEEGSVPRFPTGRVCERGRLHHPALDLQRRRLLRPPRAHDHHAHAGRQDRLRAEPLRTIARPSRAAACVPAGPGARPAPAPPLGAPTAQVLS